MKHLNLFESFESKNESWRIMINGAFNNLRWKLKSKTNKEIETKLQEMEKLINKLFTEFEEKYLENELTESLNENQKFKVGEYVRLNFSPKHIEDLSKKIPKFLNNWNNQKDPERDISAGGKMIKKKREKYRLKFLQK